MSDPEIDRQRKSRRTLLLVAAVCIAPFIGSFITYYFWQPSGRVNYGELVEGVVLPIQQLPRAGVQTTAPTGSQPAAQPVSPPGTRGATASKLVDLGKLRGHWIFVTADTAACDDYCKKKLWQMRQVRMTQGKSLERIERLWLLTDDGAVAPAVEQEYEGTHIGNAQNSAVLKALPVKTGVRDHIWLIDPLGNVILRYPRDADPSRMKKDIERLLKVSRVG